MILEWNPAAVRAHEIPASNLFQSRYAEEHVRSLAAIYLPVRACDLKGN